MERKWLPLVYPAIRDEAGSKPWSWESQPRRLKDSVPGSLINSQMKPPNRPDSVCGAGMNLERQEGQALSSGSGCREYHTCEEGRKRLSSCSEDQLPQHLRLPLPVTCHLPLTPASTPLKAGTTLPLNTPERSWQDGSVGIGAGHQA